MSVIKYRSLSNKEEFNAAKEVSNSFYVGEMGADNIQKNHYWDYQKEIDLSFIVGAFDDKKVIGLIRIIPTRLKIGKEFKNSACITSVVVKKDYRGRGISRGLMNQAIATLEEKKIEVAYLFARRAVDNYYNKFGFVGLSSYETISKIKIKALEDSNNVFELRNSKNSANISQYNEFYNDTYKNCLGAIARDSKYWESLINRLDSVVDVNFVELYQNNQLEGYAIVQNGEEVKVLELSCSSKISTKAIPLLVTKKNVSTLIIPHNHPSVLKTEFIDRTINHRLCVNGGHMVKLVGVEFSQKPLGLYDSVKGMLISTLDNPTHIGTSLSFNFSWPDQL